MSIFIIINKFLIKFFLDLSANLSKSYALQLNGIWVFETKFKELYFISSIYFLFSNVLVSYVYVFVSYAIFSNEYIIIVYDNLSSQIYLPGLIMHYHIY